jgi:hypothetical protein
MLVIVSTSAWAQESENAVPLFLGLEPGSIIVETISLAIDGRQVTVSTKLTNPEKHGQTIGWYAYTPQFGVLGTGETYLDKTFADVRATLDRRPSPARAYQRGFFLGSDITAELVRAGLPPLPDLNADARKLARLRPIASLRVNQWKGYVSYAWTASVPAKAHVTVSVQYRALPEFVLLDADAAVFTNLIRQHCGDPAVVLRRMRSDDEANAAMTQVIYERYDVPVDYLRQRDVDVHITQSHANRLGAHPVVTLACGLDNAAQRADVAGTIKNANAVISVLVMSTPEQLAQSKEKVDSKQ